MDGDGDADLAVGNRDRPDRVHVTRHRACQPNTDCRTSVVLLSPGRSADYYATSDVLEGTIPINYRLFDPRSRNVNVRVTYSRDGGGTWLPAVAASGTTTSGLQSRPYPIQAADNRHVYNWDTVASSFAGRSDNVVVRLEAWPDVRPLSNDTPDP